jgi:glycosyltransferase involved in cell wall biosynthesis
VPIAVRSEAIGAQERMVTPTTVLEGSQVTRGSENRIGRNLSTSYAPLAGKLQAGVSFRGVLYGGSGYAQENLMIAMALREAGIPVRMEPLQQQFDADNLLSEDTRVAMEFAKLQPIDLTRGVYFQSMPAHDFQTNLFARRRIGRTMFETDRIPDGWLEKCTAMDEVWVPSFFNVETFVRSGVPEQKLRRMPEGEDTNFFHPGNPPFRILGTRGFNFLSVFQWTQRKAPDVLLKAYLSEFKEDEDVTLLLRCYGRQGPDSDLLPDLLFYIERVLGFRLERIPPILLIPGFIANHDLPRLYTSADCFVLPSRGEGWGRPYVEALCSEIPVIATRWSGQMDFLSDQNSYLIDYKLAPTPADTDVELFSGHQWAEPDVDHLRALMRHVFTHREEAQQKAAVGRTEMVEKYGRDVIMARWVKEISRLLD